ncbi:hypothetical protein Fleli_0931 [Bernardetia litoralis DSM 6794]|uniref:Uncharacterized protein n=1 Tax=Bernardetia litoralis (strain ATCC 23117 / DSM 6794 / NBRC 15988 / NCIMB 1366 / Fx l1 / Sio-4) TaxID=880071 RepID=I4AHF0_BERLS|nr:hypothetical protein [Bernardetia litoralis]AFM03385.1 hypothetical protein Fleli_0931 [Bernardetia litoralis DSM 6794]
MKIKIINLLLSLTIFSAIFFIGRDYFLLQKLNNLAEEYKPKEIEFLLERSKKMDIKLDALLADANGFNTFGSFINTNSISSDSYMHPRDLEVFKTYKLIKPLDSIIASDLLGSKWEINKAKIQEILLKVAQKDDKLQVEIDRYNKQEIYYASSFNEYLYLTYLVINLKERLRGRMGQFCMCFYPRHEFRGIPSKKVVQVGDTVFVDWVNYYGGHTFIDQTYQVQSNYDKFHILETTYDPCKQCDERAETILLEEYQIPFSEIDKNKKWRSVFYFRNDKLEQDSVVLERELEF